jgi:hypothetical protein
MLRSRISADIKDLNKLHETHRWIPNESMIRPNEKTLEIKQQFNRYIDNMWMSPKDYILATHFKYETDMEDGRIYVPNVTQNEWNFSESMFPYNVRTGTHHYVLWNSSINYYHQFEEQKINKLIIGNLKKITESDKFKFVWYINPKPSIPELWHCQVFWVES